MREFGSVKSFIHVFTGYDIVSGEQVHRGEELVNIVLGCFPGGKIVTRVENAKEVGEEVIVQAFKKGDNKVYRRLAEGENIAQGLSARTPGAGNSPVGHVAGKKETQWISTTKDKDIATNKYGEHGVV